MVFGLVCLVFGAGIWLLNLYGGGFNWGRDWPFLLLLFGIYKIPGLRPNDFNDSFLVGDADL